MTTTPTAEQAIEMLSKIVQRASKAGNDSSDQPMVKVRAALLREAEDLLVSLNPDFARTLALR